MAFIVTQKSTLSMAKKLNHRYEKPAIFICIFAFSFVLRLIFAFQWSHMPYGDIPILDAQSYDHWALTIVDGHYLGSHAFYQSPIYPYILAVLYQIFGHDYFFVSLMNDALDSGTAVILSFVALSLFGRGAALLTGLLTATYAPMIFYSAPVMKESLTLFLLASFLFLSLRVVKENRLCHYAQCGFVLGLSIIARGNAMFLAPLIPIFSWMQYRHQSWPGIALFFLTILLAILPTISHNYIVVHDFVPLTYDAGFNLYIGHSPYANGTNAYPPEVSTDPEQERLNTTWIAKQESGRQLLPSEVSAFWQTKALHFALTHRLREIELLGFKLFAFWNGTPGFDNYDISFIKQNFPSLLNMPLPNFELVVVLAAFTVGAGWVTLKRKSKPDFLFLVACTFSYMCSVLIFYVTDRYRLPIVIFLLPLAGGATSCAHILWSQKKHKQLMAAWGLTILLLGITSAKPLNAVDLSAFDWGTLTTIYADKDDMERTLDAFQKGAAISPQDMGGQAYVRAAEVYEHSNHREAAAQLINKAVELYPKDGVVLYNLGRMQALNGNLDGALVTLQKAQVLSPTYGLTYFALAKLYKKKGDTKRAIKTLKDGLAANPEDPWLLSLKEEWEPM